VELPVGSIGCQTAYYMGAIRESFYPLRSNQTWLLFPKLRSVEAKCLGCKKVEIVLGSTASPFGRVKPPLEESNVFPTSDAFHAFNGWVEKSS